MARKSSGARWAAVRKRGAGAFASQSGFVLIIVLWGIGLMSLLSLTVIRSADVHARVAANDVENAGAEALAEAGVNIDIYHLVSNRLFGSSPTDRFTFNGKPVFCSMPDGTAALDIEDEGGKVDLNAAPAELLSRLFTSSGATEDEARSLTDSIVDYRSGFDAASRGSQRDTTVASEHSLFQTSLELRRIRGMTPGLFAALSPYTTVYARSAGIDLSLASPKLLEMLRGSRGQNIPEQFVTTSISTSFLLRAEILGNHHSFFVREAVVEIPTEDPQHIYVREWRRGDSRFSAELEQFADLHHLTPC